MLAYFVCVVDWGGGEGRVSGGGGGGDLVVVFFGLLYNIGLSRHDEANERRISGRNE